MNTTEWRSPRGESAAANERRRPSRPGTDSPVSDDSSIDEVGGHHQAAVGGHPVAGLEQHDVAGHEVVGDHLDDVAVAAHPDLGDQHLLQGGEGVGRPWPPGRSRAPR